MFFSDSELAPKQLLSGVTLRAVCGEKTMLTIFNFEPNAVIPSHNHPHEQITYVIQGALEFVLEGRTRVLGAGDGVVVGSGLEHSARVLDQRAKVVDAWYPIREDYRPAP